MTYMKLWLRAFKLIYKREGFRSACFLMVYARHQRATHELQELVELLESMRKENI